jgi:tetratricopeptide (TPR) repeat protein
MGGSEICDKTIQAIIRELPADPDDIVFFLRDVYLKHLNHPCFFDVAAEVRSILTTRCTPESFSMFCVEIKHPDVIITPLLSDVSMLLESHNYESAAKIIEYLLSYEELIRPAVNESQKARSFRDLIEYTYYMVVCEPAQEIIIHPFLGTDILYHYGLFLSGVRKDELALEVLEKALIQSPVHAGIMNSIVAIFLKMNRNEDAGRVQKLLTESFRCAWMKEELAHTFRNQGRLFLNKGDYEGAVSCFLMAETWDDSQAGREEIRFMADLLHHDLDTGYYNTHGKEILASRNVPVEPSPEITDLLIQIAYDYLEEQNLFKAREYLFRAYQLLMSDELNEKIWRIERIIEDTVDF